MTLNELMLGVQVGTIDLKTAIEAIKSNGIGDIRLRVVQTRKPEQPEIDGVFVKTPDGSDWCPLADFARAIAEEMNKA